MLDNYRILVAFWDPWKVSIISPQLLTVPVLLEVLPAFSKLAEGGSDCFDTFVWVQTWNKIFVELISEVFETVSGRTHTSG